MSENEYYTAANHGPFETYSLGTFELEDGGAIDELELAYATFGSLSSARDNAVLVPTWYSGTHGIMSQVYVGEGRALDPVDHFVVIVDQIGSGLSTSPHHRPDQDFPRVRIGDDVRAQERLLREHLGVEELQLVFGGSMGGQQTYEWAVRFPDRVKRAAPLAATARTPDLNRIFVDALGAALSHGDRASQGLQFVGAVDPGLVDHARLVAVMGFSNDFWVEESWRTLGFESANGFLEGFMYPYFAPMDPGDLLCQMWKWQHADVSRHTGGDLPAALGRIRAKTFVMPIEHDGFFPERDCRDDQVHIEGSELRTIHSTYGHLALFGLEPSFIQQVDDHLAALLAAPA